jgi:hypothetical protein
LEFTGLSFTAPAASERTPQPVAYSVCRVATAACGLRDGALSVWPAPAAPAQSQPLRLDGWFGRVQPPRPLLPFHSDCALPPRLCAP